MTAAFIAPADVPEMPSISSQGSSSRRSSTPQVNAPCDPPPCKARSTRTGLRAIGLVALVGISHLKRLVGTRFAPGVLATTLISQDEPESVARPQNRNAH